MYRLLYQAITYMYISPGGNYGCLGVGEERVLGAQTSLTPVANEIRYVCTMYPYLHQAFSSQSNHIYSDNDNDIFYSILLLCGFLLFAFPVCDGQSYLPVV